MSLYEAYGFWIPSHQLLPIIWKSSEWVSVIRGISLKYQLFLMIIFFLSFQTQMVFIDAFLQNNRLDHLTQLMGYHPTYLENFLRTQQYLLRGDGPLPFHYRHYIAIMVRIKNTSNGYNLVKRYSENAFIDYIYRCKVFQW